MIDRDTAQEYAIGRPYTAQWDRPPASVGRALSLIAFFLLLIAIIMVALALKYGASFLRVNRPEPSDVIVVLGGGWDDTRYEHALELRKGGYGKIIILDAEDLGQKFGTNNFKLATEYVARTGVKDVIVCPIGKDSTYGETEDAAKCLLPLHPSSVLLVTSDYHTRRAFDIFKSRLPKYHWSVAASWTPLERDRSTRMYSDQWWKQREWAKTVFEEWQRLIWWNLVDRWKPHLVYQS